MSNDHPYRPEPRPMLTEARQRDVRHRRLRALTERHFRAGFLTAVAAAIAVAVIGSSLAALSSIADGVDWRSIAAVCSERLIKQTGDLLDCSRRTIEAASQSLDHEICRSHEVLMRPGVELQACGPTMRGTRIFVLGEHGARIGSLLCILRGNGDFAWMWQSEDPSGAR